MILFTIKSKPLKERKLHAPLTKVEKNKKAYSRKKKHKDTNE